MLKLRVLLTLVMLTGLLVTSAKSAVMDHKVENDITADNGLNCIFYDSRCSEGKEDDSECYTSKNCYEDVTITPGTEVFCYTVWKNGTEPNTFEIKNQGCLSNQAGAQNSCRERSECVEERPGKTHMFCCCTGDNCNQDFRWDPVPSPVTTPPTVPTPHLSSKMFLPLYLAVPVLVLLVIGLAGLYIYRQKKSASFNSLSQSEQCPVSPPSPNFIHRPVQLIEIKARGRFGAVWKGEVGDEKAKAAIKIFPLQDKHSWFAEQEIYSLPQMSHENILKFVGVDKRGDGLQTEFWLITAFHERGSLCDYLKLNTVDIHEMCKISLGIATGLTHLHTELPATAGGRGIKPAIAHRDFKSKNVLIKSDGTACIGDFGLALQFKPNEIVGDTHGQVGTRRYMAPEVLEGAINFSRDAFLRIDMYACGLVLWEIATRCRDVGTVASYKLPFEAEASPHPTLEEISDLVVNRKVRPELKEAWRKHEALSILCETIEECWDHDAEARLSASCVLERLLIVKSIINSMDSINEEDTSRLLCQEALNNSINNQMLLSQPMVPQIIMQSINPAPTSNNSSSDHHEQ